MSTPPVAQQATRQRVLAVLEQVVGYPVDPGAEQLTDLDSLQVLELLVSLEQEFDIDSDRIIESQPNWWGSMTGLVDSIDKLRAEEHPHETTRE